MNDLKYFYSDGTPRPRSLFCEPRRSMKEIKADYNANLQRHSLDVTKRRH